MITTAIDQARVDRAFDAEDLRIRELEREFHTDPAALLDYIVAGVSVEEARQCQRAAQLRRKSQETA